MPPLTFAPLCKPLDLSLIPHHQENKTSRHEIHQLPPFQCFCVLTPAAVYLWTRVLPLAYLWPHLFPSTGSLFRHQSFLTWVFNFSPSTLFLSTHKQLFLPWNTFPWSCLPSKLCCSLFPFSLLNLLKGRSTLAASISSLPNHFPTCCNWFIPTTLRTLTKAEILNWKLKDVFNSVLIEYKSFWNCC